MIFIAELKEKQNEKIKEIMNNNLTDIDQIKILLGDIYYENNIDLEISDMYLKYNFEHLKGVKDYENNNSIANVYTGMLNENNKAYRADQIGRWKIKYYFDI